MKKVFIVVCACLLAACHNQKKEVSILSEEYIDNQTIEAPALEDWEFGADRQIGYYSLEFDSTIKDFIYFYCDTVKQVVLPYYANPDKLGIIHCAIDDIIIEKGWKYPLEQWPDFEFELQDRLGSIGYQLGEIEIDLD